VLSSHAQHSFKGNGGGAGGPAIPNPICNLLALLMPTETIQPARPSRTVIIIQRYDTSTDNWVDEIVRHASWQAHKTARAKSRLNGHDYRIVSGHSGAVLETILAAEQTTR
jgi:hypothetical protein